MLAATAMLVGLACTSRPVKDDGGGAGGSAATGTAGRGGGGDTGGGGTTGGTIGTAGMGGTTGAAGTTGAGGASGSAGRGAGGAVGAGGTTGAAGGGGTAGATGIGGRGGSAGGGRGGAGGVAGGAGGAAAGAGGRGGSAGGAGGRGGTGGSAGGAGGRGGAGAASPECTSAADCKLVDNCCSCEAIPAGATGAPCALLCIQSACAAKQLPAGKVDCLAGKCVAGFACDATGITCKVAPPACAAGEVPTINAAGNCYTGSCAPATECTTVAGCGSCTGSDQACVSYETQRGVENHCVTIPPECAGNGGCTCTGVASCLPPYGTCADYSGIRGVYCSCPNC